MVGAPPGCPTCCFLHVKVAAELRKIGLYRFTCLLMEIRLLIPRTGPAGRGRGADPGRELQSKCWAFGFSSSLADGLEADEVLDWMTKPIPKHDLILHE